MLRDHFDTATFPDAAARRIPTSDFQSGTAACCLAMRVHAAEGNIPPLIATCLRIFARYDPPRNRFFNSFSSFFFFFTRRVDMQIAV